MDNLINDLLTILPVAYSHFKSPVEVPYMVYIGQGQDALGADDTWYHRTNRYQFEYYFKLKDETKEEAIEQAFLQNGYNYTKSEDVYEQSEDVFLIYYTI